MPCFDYEEVKCSVCGQLFADGYRVIGGKVICDGCFEKRNRESTAWCPDCNDSLETVEVYRQTKEYGKIIDHHEYYCLGCDKTFVLEEKNE